MAPQIDRDIYKEEVREFLKEKKALEWVTKQAYMLIWGQCSQPIHKKLQSSHGFDKVSREADAIELLKAIKSTAFHFDNKYNMYIAIGNIINRFWYFTKQETCQTLPTMKKSRT
eukprot:4826205-Ditylum_brightwellii.AAC.1